MAEPITINGFTLKKAHAWAAFAFMVLGAAAGGGAQIALSRAMIVDHSARISVLEISDVKKSEHDTKRDAQWDDLILGITKLNATVEKQNDKLDALGLQVARGSRR